MTLRNAAGAREQNNCKSGMLQKEVKQCEVKNKNKNENKNLKRLKMQEQTSQTTK